MPWFVLWCLLWSYVTFNLHFLLLHFWIIQGYFRITHSLSLLRHCMAVNDLLSTFLSPYSGILTSTYIVILSGWWQNGRFWPVSLHRNMNINNHICMDLHLWKFWIPDESTGMEKRILNKVGRKLSLYLRRPYPTPCSVHQKGISSASELPLQEKSIK